MTGHETGIILQSFSRIYELLKTQQESLLDVYIKAHAFELALKNNPILNTAYQKAVQQIRTPELIRTHELGMSLLDSLIRELKGETKPPDA